MKLFYKKFGFGMPIVILHGLYGSSDNWISIAKALASSFEVYLVDLRNHGNSPHDNIHNYEVMRDDLLEFLDDANLKKAILAGHSMGGKAVMCFAQHNPHRAERIIVIDIAPKSYKDLYRKEALSHYDILRAMKNANLSSVSSRKDVGHALSETIKNSRIRSFLMKNLRKEEGGGYYWNLNLDVLIRELDNIMDGINKNCFDPLFPINGLPALFIRGDRSPYVLDSDMDFIYKIFPSAKLKTISDAGHWLHAEQPGAFIEAVKEFSLNELRT